jgi:hypothetical protein
MKTHIVFYLVPSQIPRSPPWTVDAISHPSLTPSVGRCPSYPHAMQGLTCWTRSLRLQSSETIAFCCLAPSGHRSGHMFASLYLIYSLCALLIYSRDDGSTSVAIPPLRSDPVASAARHLNSESKSSTKKRPDSIGPPALQHFGLWPS